LVGFMAKFQIFSVLYDAGQSYAAQGQDGLSKTMFALLVIGGLNTVVSAMYYIKVLRVMILDRRLEEIEGRPTEPLKVPGAVSGFAAVLALVILGLGIVWWPLDQASRSTGVDGFPPHSARTERGAP
jgi:NADH:ubiquinone oxidoreductase subunit 2 (subunit N)